MARARNIKPGFFDNPELGAISSDARLLYIALWLLADREGVVEYSAAVFKRFVFGFRDDVTEKDIHGYITVLSRLDNQQLISIKEHTQKRYILMGNFDDDQNPHHTEKKGKLPSRIVLENIEEIDLTVTSPLCNGYTSADSGFLIPDSGFLIPEVKPPCAEKPKPKNIYSEKFEAFWKLYPPTAASKSESWKSYQQAEKKGVNHEIILRSLEKYVEYLAVSGTPAAHATTWLNQQRWSVDYAGLIVRESQQQRGSGYQRTADPATTARNIGEEIIRKRREQREREAMAGNAPVTELGSTGRIDSVAVSDLRIPEGV